MTENVGSPPVAEREIAAYFGFLERAAGAFGQADRPDLRSCRRCGGPTTAGDCAFCRLRERVAAASE